MIEGVGKARWAGAWKFCGVAMLTCSALHAPAAWAQTPPTGKDAYIALGQAKLKKTLLAFAPTILGGGESASTSTAWVESVRKVLAHDLEFMEMFEFLDPKTFLEPAPGQDGSGGLALSSLKVSDWSTIGTEYLIKSQLTVESPGKRLALEVHLHDIVRAKTLMAKRYLATPQDAKTVGHTAANDVVQALTGLPGIFLTKIAMSCDVSGKKEIYLMDFDGSDVRQLTRHRSIAFAPAWSPDGTRLAYSLFNKNNKNQKNIDLFEYHFGNQTLRKVSSRRGINSGAAYHPNGGSLAVTLSHTGSPAIYLLNPDSGSLTQLTKSAGTEVDPSWSPDGKSLAYVSTRTGRPMIFKMNADGSRNQQLTFAGTFNATPSWSPQNNKIAFAGWLDKTFDLFIMNPDGTNIQRLTKDQGKNEDPHFSPDGNFIVFSSDRAGSKSIYVMNVDGTMTRRLTYGLGNCVAPKWSQPPPPPRQMEAS